MVFEVTISPHKSILKFRPIYVEMSGGPLHFKQGQSK